MSLAFSPLPPPSRTLLYPSLPTSASSAEFADAYVILPFAVPREPQVISDQSAGGKVSSTGVAALIFGLGKEKDPVLTKD